MPLNSTDLTEEIETALMDGYAKMPADAGAARRVLAQAIATAVVDHFTNNAEVPITITIDADLNATLQETLISGKPGTPVTGNGTAIQTQTLTVGIQ